MQNMELLCMPFSVIEPHLAMSGKSQNFSQFTVGIWGIFSSYGRDGNSKLVLVQRSQDSCLISRDISGISTKHGRAIRKLLDVSRETECPFLVARVILVFRSIFNKSQASSHFEQKSPCLSKCQRDVRPPVQMRCEPRTFSRISMGIQTSLHLVR